MNIFNYFTRKKNTEIDLSKPTEFLFKKYNNTNYYMMYYKNPVFNKYWPMPKFTCSKYYEFSFYKHPYDLGSSQEGCSYNNIQSLKDEFATLSDIQQRFDKMNVEFFKEKILQTELRNLPDQVK